MAGARLTVEVLYVEGCPHHHGLVARLRALIAELHPDASVVLKRVESAKRLRTSGSSALPPCGSTGTTSTRTPRRAPTTAQMAPLPQRSAAYGRRSGPP